MHYHVWGSHRAKFDDDHFNSFRGITCEAGTHKHRQTRQTDFGLINVKLFQSHEQKEAKKKRNNCQLASFPAIAGKTSTDLPKEKTKKTTDSDSMPFIDQADMATYLKSFGSKDIASVKSCMAALYSSTCAISFPRTENKMITRSSNLPLLNMS